MKKVATQLLVFEDGTTNLYQFGYEQYQEKLDREAEESKNVYRGKCNIWRRDKPERQQSDRQ